MNRPIVACVTQSRRNRYSSRGPKSVATIERTSSATEKISARTVLTQLSIALRMARASSMPPIVSHTGRWMYPSASSVSGIIVSPKSAMLASESPSGIRQRLTFDCACLACDLEAIPLGDSTGWAPLRTVIFS